MNLDKLIVDLENQWKDLQERSPAPLNKLSNWILDDWDQSSPVVKVIGFNFLLGYGLGSLGEVTDSHWIPAVPLVMDATYGSLHPLCLIYCVGVACAYSEKMVSSLDKSGLLY